MKKGLQLVGREGLERLVGRNEEDSVFRAGRRAGSGRFCRRICPCSRATTHWSNSSRTLNRGAGAVSDFVDDCSGASCGRGRPVAFLSVRLARWRCGRRLAFWGGRESGGGDDSWAEDVDAGLGGRTRRHRARCMTRATGMAQTRTRSAGESRLGVRRNGCDGPHRSRPRN